MKTTAGTSEWYSEHLNWSTSTIGKNALRGRKMLSLMQVVGQIRIHRIVKEVMFSEIIRDPEKLNVRGLPDSPVYEDVKEAEGEMMRARPDWPDGISVGHHEVAAILTQHIVSTCQVAHIERICQRAGTKGEWGAAVRSVRRQWESLLKNQIQYVLVGCTVDGNREWLVTEAGTIAWLRSAEGEISSADASPDGYVCEPSRHIRCGGVIHEGLRDPATIALGRSGGSGAACQAADSPALVRAH